MTAGGEVPPDGQDAAIPTTGLSKRALARTMSFDPSYVSHIESGRHQPTEEFARQAEQALNSGNSIMEHWAAYAAARGRPRPTTVPQPGIDGAELLVEDDHAELVFDGARYTLRMRRRLRNVGDQPITRYLIRISVDRYPGDPERSNAHYRAHPLTWHGLGLTAGCEDQPMNWHAAHDRDAFKEVWLEFANNETRFPLYPGDTTQIEYSYTVDEQDWGHWFQRAVRLPTRRLSVRLAFPTTLGPRVWGLETSLTVDRAPLPTAPRRTVVGDTTCFDWEAIAPALHARFRLEWSFATDQNPASVEEV